MKDRHTKAERYPDATQAGCRAHPSHHQYDNVIVDLHSQEINQVQEERRGVVKNAPIGEGLELVAPKPMKMTNDRRRPRFINRKNVGHSDVIRGNGNERQNKG